LKLISKKLLTAVAVTLLFSPLYLSSQSFINNGQVHGNFQIDAQTYHVDEDVGISEEDIDGKVFRFNGFGDIKYTNGRFSAGLRYEAYLPPLAGFDLNYEGNGIPYWFVDYKGDQLQITAGNFYEQFGTGLILRSYQEWDLGYDNSIKGLRVKYNPTAGIYLKALAGTHRYYWEPYKDGNRGIIRAFDAEFVLNDMFESMKDNKTRFIIGGSFVSKYEKSQKSETLVQDSSIIKFEHQLPDNAASTAGRLTITHGGFSLNTEYVYKFNNPSAFNDYIYKTGDALYLSTAYSTKGFGIILSAKRIDNMSYKSKIDELNNVADINFIPPLTKPHIYTLSTIYPYATQMNGETALQGQVIYSVPKKSKLGGKYGMKLELNYSLVHGLDTEPVEWVIPDKPSGTDGYSADFFAWGDLYFQDLNITLKRKVSPSFKFTLEYVNLTYNIEVIEGHPDEPIVHASIGIIDMTYKMAAKKSLRLELQHLFTEQDKGDWAMFLLEFNIAPKWFFTIMDQYNYGNPDSEMQLHYFIGNIAYVQGPHRISLGYGRQREGLLCVGGVCRQVPASNGFTLSISSSF